jgi:hypothetical protein
LDQREDDVVVNRGRQAVLLVRGDGQPPADLLAGLRVDDPVLVLDLGKTLGGAVREKGDWELRDVHLVPAGEKNAGGVSGCNGLRLLRHGFRAE